MKHFSQSNDLDQTELKILGAALQVLAHKGVQGATTRAIATAADVNEVTLFRRFGTKMDLLRIAITHHLEATMHASAQFTGDLEADLIRIADEYHEALKTVGPLAKVVLSEIAHTPELEDSVATVQRFYHAIAELLAQYQQEGSLNAEPKWWTVMSFLGPIAMPFVVHEIVPKDADFPFDAGLYVHRFLDGRRPAKDPNNSPTA